MLHNGLFKLVFPVFTISLLLLSLPDKAQAQSAADNAARQAEQLERDRAADERQRQLERNRLNNRPPGGADVDPPQRDVATPGETCIQVNTVSVTGVTLLQTETVNKIVSGFEGKCLGLSELNNIRKQLTFLYVEKGYITSRAFLPEQDLADGSLEIVVVEGSLESIVMDNETDAYKSQIATAFPNLVGKTVNLRDIEQGLDQLNLLRSNNAKIELEAGKEPGSSVLQVSRNKSKNWYGTVGFDNLGSSSTGEYQSRIYLGFEDVLRLNDQWNFSYQRSMDRHPFHFDDVPSSDTYTGSFSIPYGYWKFGVDGSRNEYNSQISGAVSDIDTSGFSQSVSAHLSRVLHRDQVSITSLSGKLKWKRNENFILGSRVDVSSRDLSIGTLELVHSRQLWNGQLVATVSYHQGLDIWGAFDDDTAPVGSPKGQFRSANGSISYFKPFKLGDLTASYNGQISGQYTPDLLFGSEQVPYGGYSTVRGLRKSVVFGNRGIMTRNEFALRLPQSKNQQLTKMFGTLEAYTAIDFAHVFEQDSFGIDGGNLTGGTIGLRSRGGMVSFDVAWSDIIASSNNLDAAVAKSGLVYAMVNLSF